MSYHFWKQKKKKGTYFSEPNWQNVLAFRQKPVLPQLTWNSCLLSRRNLSAGSTWPVVSLISKVLQDILCLLHAGSQEVWGRNVKKAIQGYPKSWFPVKARPSLGFSPPPHGCLAVLAKTFTRVEVAPADPSDQHIQAPSLRFPLNSWFEKESQNAATHVFA